MKNYDETTIKRLISKKKSIRITGNLIEVNKDNIDCGKGTWAKIDYLCNYCGYRYMITAFANSSKKKTTNMPVEDDDIQLTSKTSKREAKLNISKLAKHKMYAKF